MVTGNAPTITKRAQNAVYYVLPGLNNNVPRNDASVKASDVSGKDQIEVVFLPKASRLRRQHSNKLVKLLSTMILELGTVQRETK